MPQILRSEDIIDVINHHVSTIHPTPLIFIIFRYVPGHSFSEVRKCIHIDFAKVKKSFHVLFSTGLNEV